LPIEIVLLGHYLLRLDVVFGCARLSSIDELPQMALQEAGGVLINQSRDGQ